MAVVYVVTLIVLSLGVVIVSSITSNDEETREPETPSNIAFEVTDLIATATQSCGQVREYEIEAFRSIHNDRIINAAGRPGLSQLSWVSIGNPMFIKSFSPGDELDDGENSSTSSMRLLHFVSSGFYTYIQTLTPAHRQLLVATANTKYKIEISDAQIVNMKLSHFECRWHVNDNLFITGQVSNFQEFPLRMDFKAKLNSEPYHAFTEMLQEVGDKDLIFNCRILSQGRKTKTNLLTIEFQQLERVGLRDKLFGPSSGRSDQTGVVFVTRDQLLTLAGELYSTLNIVEDYQIPRTEFSASFVLGLIEKAAVSHFQLVEIDAALDTLSKFGLDMKEDLRPDIVKRDLGSLLVVERSDDKARIALNQTKYGEFQRHVDQKRGGNMARRLGIDGSAEWAKFNVQRGPISAETKSLDEQLRDLNQASNKEINWTLEGDRIVPKSLNVARVENSNINRTLTFNRIRHQSYTAPYDKNFTLYTRNVACRPSTSVKSPVDGGMSTEFVSVSQSIGKVINAMKTELRNAVSDVATSVEQLRGVIERHMLQTPPSVVCSQHSSPIRLMFAAPQRSLPDGRCVWGLATFNGKLYVGREGTRGIEIYDPETLTLQNHLVPTELGCLHDMASRPGSSVMYIADNCYNQVIVVEQNGTHRYFSVGGKPRSLSVMLSSSNVLISYEDATVLREYTPTGERVREIALPPSVVSPTHAIQLSFNRFAVGQAPQSETGLHQITLIDDQGRVVQTFGHVRGSGSTGTRVPLRLVHVHGSLFVIDQNNDRVIMLNATSLAYIREVISEPTESDFLGRIALSDTGARMFVAHNRIWLGTCIRGHVKTYDLTWM